MDQTLIKGLKIYAYHGVNPEEKRDGQPFVIDAVLYTDHSAAAESDNLQDTTNYSAAVKAIIAAMTAESYDLIETAAEHVAQRLLADFPRLFAVEITLKKPQAPVKAEFDYMAVRIYRDRSGRS